MKIAFQLDRNAQGPTDRVVLESIMSALRLVASRPALALMAWTDTPPVLPGELTNLADDVIHLPGGPVNEPRLTALLKQHGVDAFFSLSDASAPSVDLPRVVWPFDFPLVPHIPDDTWDIKPAEALAPLTLPGKFFFMPNPIQPHGNHALVVTALVTLRRRNIPAGVVCTGVVPTGQDAFFQELKDAIHAAGVERHVTFLGAVPPATVRQLMRHSLAILNPALSGECRLAVAEAAYFAKPAVLSDIPAFHEHVTIDSVFFNPVNSDDLAGRMERTWRKFFQPVGRKTALIWQDRYHADRAAFAGKLMSLFKSAAGCPSHPPSNDSASVDQPSSS